MFAPDDWLDRFRLLQVKNLYGVWVAMAFWISLSIVIVDFVATFRKHITQKIQKRKNLNICINNLKNLDNTEKRILKLIFDNDSISLDYTNASVNKLEVMHMVMRPPISDVGTEFSYSLQPWLRKHLNNHPEYFGDKK